MVETSARLLKLLALLQAHREWAGTDLAGRLGVTTRTVRRDVERLRELGYPVHAAQGTAGYRLGSGASLPPLLLDDDEAVAVVVGLRTATGGSVTGIEEASVRALSKVEQVLPSRLRARVTMLNAATVRGGTAPGPKVSADVLMAVAQACRRHERLRFDYTNVHGDQTVRAVEPHTLVSFNRHWYLVAWDTERDDWRTFRADRITPRTPTGPRFPPREPPHGDVLAYLNHQLSVRTWPCRATVRLTESVDEAAEHVWPGMGSLEAVDDTTCLLHLGGPTPADLVWMITLLRREFTLVSGPPELADALRTLAERCLASLS